MRLLELLGIAGQQVDSRNLMRDNGRFATVKDTRNVLEWYKRTSVISTANFFDFDHVCSKICQQHSCSRTSQNTSEIQNTDIPERRRHSLQGTTLEFALRRRTKCPSKRR